MSTATKWYLGSTKGPRPSRIYLFDFRWESWYWSGGQIGNSSLLAHFNGAFLDMPDPRGHCLGNFVTPWTTDARQEQTVLKNGAAVWEPLTTFLNNARYTAEEWWRIKDLFKQFYALKAAAEVFLYGGHCTQTGRTAAEINPEMAAEINKQIENVIIPELRKVLNHGK